MARPPSAKGPTNTASMFSVTMSIEAGHTAKSHRTRKGQFCHVVQRALCLG